MSASGGSGFHPCHPPCLLLYHRYPHSGEFWRGLGLLAFSLLPLVFVTFSDLCVTFVLVLTAFATVTTGDGTPEMALIGHCFPILGVLLSFHLQHTTTAGVAVMGMTRSPLVIDRLTVEQRGCTCIRFNLIHGTQVTPTFATTLIGVSGIFRPFLFATFGGRGTTSTQVFLEEFLHVGVILPLEGQLDQQVHKFVVRVCRILPLRGSGAIVPRTRRGLTHEPQVGLCGSIGTHVHP